MLLTVLTGCCLRQVMGDPLSNDNYIFMKNQTFANWEEMLFEGKEKRYGAYELRVHYPRRLLIALGLAVVFFLGITLGPFLWAKAYGMSTDSGPRKTTQVILDMLPPLEKKETEKELVAPPPVEPIIEKVKLTEFTIPKPDPEADEEITIKSVDTLNMAKNIALFDLDGKDEESIFAGPVDVDDFDIVKKPSIPGDKDFVVVEEQPQPINMADIQKLVGYPQLARDAGIQGSVVLRVLVDKSGNYKDHKIINQAHPILSKAVEAKIELLKFTPAIQGGKPIYFWVNIPFNFRLLD